jgi:hypothetical protein
VEHFLEVLFCQSVKHSLQFGLDPLIGIKPTSFQLKFLFFGNRKNSQGAKSGEYSGRGLTTIFCFARNCRVRMLFLYLIHRENRHRSLTRLQVNTCGNFHVHPAMCNLAHWLTRHRNPTIYRCFALPQLLYWWRHQSGMFWIPLRIYRVIAKLNIINIIIAGVWMLALWIRHSYLLRLQLTMDLSVEYRVRKKRCYSMLFELLFSVKSCCWHVAGMCY